MRMDLKSHGVVAHITDWTSFEVGVTPTTIKKKTKSGTIDPQKLGSNPVNTQADDDALMCSTCSLPVTFANGSIPAAWHGASTGAWMTEVPGHRRG
jgi:hypothetical protein